MNDDKSKSILLLILGIGGFFIFPLGVIAIILGQKYKKEGWQMDDLGQVGYILGIISVSVFGLSIICYITVLIVFMALTSAFIF